MPRVWADKDFDTRVRRHLYVIYLCSWELYVISSRISFLISKFLCDWYNLAINKATLHVNESCLICLIHKRTHLLWVFLLPRSIHSFFYLSEDRVTNKNQIYCYILFDNAPNIAIKKRSKFSTLIKMCYIFFTPVLELPKAFFKISSIHCMKGDVCTSFRIGFFFVAYKVWSFNIYLFNPFIGNF